MKHPARRSIFERVVMRPGRGVGWWTGGGWFRSARLTREGGTPVEETARLPLLMVPPGELRQRQARHRAAVERQPKQVGVFSSSRQGFCSTGGTHARTRAHQEQRATPGEYIHIYMAEPDSMESVPVANALSEGLNAMLQPMVDKTDNSIQAAIDSQAVLSQQIDRVASELQAFLSAVALPSFAPYADRLSDVRRRVNVASNTLTQVQARLARVEQLADRLQAEDHYTLARRQGVVGSRNTPDSTSS